MNNEAEIYKVIEFPDKSISLAPANWCTRNNNFVLWPPRIKRYSIRKYQKNKMKPEKDWQICKISKIWKADLSYKQAREEEKRLSNNSYTSTDYSSDSYSDEEGEGSRETVNKKTPTNVEQFINLDHMWQANTATSEITDSSSSQRHGSDDLLSKTVPARCFDDINVEQVANNVAIAQNEVQTLGTTKTLPKSQDQNEQCLEAIKTTLVDLTNELRMFRRTQPQICSKKVAEVVMYHTKEDFVALNEQLLKDKNIKTEFIHKIQTIFEYNKDEINGNMEKFYKLILKAFFHNDLLKKFTWISFKDTINVTHTEVFKVIQFYGLLVNNSVSEHDRYKVLKETLRKLKDCNRKEKQKKSKCVLKLIFEFEFIIMIFIV